MTTTTVTAVKKTIIDKTGSDTYNISADCERVTIAGKLSGDTINVEGLASDFTVKAVGRTITLTSDTLVLKFQLQSNTGTATVAFLDGSLVASHVLGKGSFLGTQKLAIKAVDVSDDALGDTTSADVFDSTAVTTSNLAVALTDSVETVTGGSGNDTFSAIYDDTLNAFDSISGGDGTDTLRVTSDGDDVTDLGSADISSVETLSVQAAAALIDLDLSDESFTTVNLKTTGDNDVTLVDGTATTVSVSTNNEDSLVDITATAATSISIGGKDNDQANLVVAENVLKTLTLTGIDGGSVALDTDSGDDDITSLTLVVGASDVTFTDSADMIETLTVKATGTTTLTLDVTAATALSVTASGTTEIVGTDLDAVETLTLAGAGDITLDGDDFAALVTVAAGSATGDLVLDNIDATVTTTVTTGSGDDALEITGAPKAAAKYTLGAGNDTVTVDTAAILGASVAGGAGTDRLIVDGALATILSSTAIKAYSGFEELGLGDNSTGTINMSKATGFSSVVVDGDLGAAVFITNAAAGLGLKFTDNADTLGFAIDYALAKATGESDALAITIGDSDTDGDIDLNAGNIIADDIESISISSVDKKDSDQIIDLEADAVETLTITGNSKSLEVSLSDEVITSVKASAYTGNLDLSGLELSDDGASITTGAGDDTITTQEGDDTVIAGAGDDTITASGGDDTITTGDGEDTVVFDGAAIDGSETVTITDFTFGESADIFEIDNALFTAYSAGDAVIINVAVAEAVADLDNSGGGISNFIIADTSANLAGLDLTGATGIVLVYETDSGSIYSYDTSTAFADTADVIASIGVGTIIADNISIV